MLSTNAYAYLNIADPICAWATYRGVLVSAKAAMGSDAGAVSLMSAGLMRSDTQARLSNEFIVEGARRLRHPGRVSRLSGMYCFLEVDSAQRASALWGSLRNHFRPDFLAELHLQSISRQDRMDSNWITYARRDADGFLLTDDLSWIDRYWRGEVYPNKIPIWETVIEGRIIVLGTDLRNRAYEVIKKEFPQALGILEIARQAAWIGSDLGNVVAWLTEDQDNILMNYLMDWRDATNPDFLKRLERLNAEGHAINWADLEPHLRAGNFGNVTDLRPYGFSRPKGAMPYVRSGPNFNADHGGVGEPGGADVKPSIDDLFRLQGRLNALENLLALLVFDRARVLPDPVSWINQYVANLRHGTNFTSFQPIGDHVASRLAEETHKAILEFADMIEFQVKQGVLSAQSVATNAPSAEPKPKE